MVCSIGNPYPNLQDYAEDNLTTKSQIIANSRWFGRGAEELGLSNQVTNLSYGNAHRGQDNNGNALRQYQTNKNSIPGRDLTFSAPKSVSLLALVQENQQIINAHDRAVDRALLYIEQNCIYTRMGKGGSNHKKRYVRVDERKALRESWKHKLNLTATQISIQTSLEKEKVKP